MDDFKQISVKSNILLNGGVYEVEEINGKKVFLRLALPLSENTGLPEPSWDEVRPYILKGGLVLTVEDPQSAVRKAAEISNEVDEAIKDLVYRARILKREKASRLSRLGSWVRL